MSYRLKDTRDYIRGTKDEERNTNKNNTEYRIKDLTQYAIQTTIDEKRVTVHELRIRG